MSVYAIVCTCVTSVLRYFVLTFPSNDQTLVEICTVVLHYGLDTYQGLYRSTPIVLRKCYAMCVTGFGSKINGW